MLAKWLVPQPRLDMRIREVTKLATPQQQRVQQLQTQLDVARRAAKQAKLNQQQARIAQQRAQLNRVG